MTHYRDSRSLICFCIYLTAFIFATIAIDQENCDKKNCPGPLAYYESLGCKPVYKEDDDCCAWKYNCTHLKERSGNKCHVNGHEYDIFENLREDDANACDIGCVCLNGTDGIASFSCAIVDCPLIAPPKPGCYRKHTPANCCPGEEVCPEKPEDVATCNVSGKIYKDAEYFKVDGEPDLNCICQPGYEGKNIEPFCRKPRRPYCSPDFHRASDIFSNCIPVYYDNQSPQTSCSVFSRCQNDNDRIMHNHNESETTDGDDVCLFGNMIMHIGEELNQGTYYSSVCVKCVCEVPPVPTCQRLPNSECDITKHPVFGVNN